MNPVFLKCKNCGAALPNCKTDFVCEYCGTAYSFAEYTAVDDFEIIAGHLKAYCGRSMMVRIPDDVSVIDANCFCNSAVESVAFPEGLTIISECAFADCTELKEISLPSTLREIGRNAFRHCGLKHLILPNGIKKIGEYAFADCANLMTVTLPTHPIEYRSTFKYDQSLTNVVFSHDAFCPSFVPSTEANRGDDRRPTYFDAFQATPLFEKMEANYAAKICVRCGNSLDKKHTCPACGTRDVDRKAGCYIATSVYGSYDCTEVCALRRYRDDVLRRTAFGRMFIRIYYAISPLIVQLFGKKAWFNAFWRRVLDKKIKSCQK